MNLNLFGTEILPSQVQAANPFFILFLIPLFTYVIYPTVEKFIPLTPLRKIGAGLFLTAIAFSISAFIQEWIDAGEQPHISWQILAYLLLTSAEIMVSIVCLEFAYTHSPKSMKSMVMALFLVSVAAGNFFTSLVNSYIQVKSPLSSEVTDAMEHLKHGTSSSSQHHSTWFINSYPGYDKKLNTEDDIHVHFTNKAIVKKRDLPAESSLLKAASIIQEYALSNERKFPLTENGQSLISHISDRWGESLSYRVINNTSCRITSLGPDKIPLTQWDCSLNIEIKPDPEIKKNSDRDTKKKTWLAKRKEQLGVTNENDQIHYKNDNFIHEYSAGGLYKMEGANYFWFFTRLMLITSIIFVPYSLYFKTK